MKTMAATEAGVLRGFLKISVFFLQGVESVEGFLEPAEKVRLGNIAVRVDLQAVKGKRGFHGRGFQGKGRDSEELIRALINHGDSIPGGAVRVEISFEDQFPADRRFGA